MCQTVHIDTGIAMPVTLDELVAGAQWPLVLVSADLRMEWQMHTVLCRCCPQ
jgi:hypothetical protein